ncbi:MAG: transporter [Armatimonadetes bacterium]|nr:transporter [Armatimonadota bacterium]
MDDLGLGTRVASGRRARLLNPDGSFNVHRTGLRFWQSQSAYHALLQTSWPRFIALACLTYVAVNLLFALGYLACGPGGLHRSDQLAPVSRFVQAFFFSVHTVATIGYGNVSPGNLPAEVLVAVESLVGLLGFALVTGLVFARFARPTARILFSRVAVVAPYRGGTALMFRLANARASELSELNVRVNLSLRRDVDGAPRRTFHALDTERSHIDMFPLSWTVVHPIDESSPLSGLSREDLLAADAEVLVLVTAFEETFSQMVQQRSSYRAEQVRFGAKFATMYTEPAPDEALRVDLSRLDATE